LLSRWPLSCPSSWVEEVNRPQTEAELASLRRSVEQGRPFGSERWVQRTAASLGLEITLRPRGRPKKQIIGP
jgi:putative transposase